MAEETMTTGAETGAVTATETNQNQSAQETEAKTYTEAEMQSEIDRRVSQALNTAKANWQKEMDLKIADAKDEGARLATMTEKERVEAEREKERQEYLQDRQKFQRERLEFETAKILGEKSLPVSFAGMLAGKDAEETGKNIEAFEKAFADSLQKAVDERLKGTAPRVSTTNTAPDAFMSGFQGKKG